MASHSPRVSHPDDDVAAGTVEAHLQASQVIVMLQDLIVLFLHVACQARLGTLNVLLAFLSRLHEVVVHAHQCLVARNHLVDLFKLPRGGKLGSSPCQPAGWPGRSDTRATLGQGQGCRHLEGRRCSSWVGVGHNPHVSGGHTNRLLLLKPMECGVLVLSAEFSKRITCPAPPTDIWPRTSAKVCPGVGILQVRFEA